MRWTRHAAIALVLLQLAAAVNVIYDETRWTKEDWHKYKVEFEPLRDITPSEVAISDPALKTALSGSKLNSLDGPSERRMVSRPGAGLWYRAGQEAAPEAFDDADAIDHAAQAVQCTACHALINAAWKATVPAIHEHDVINEDSIRDALEAACESQVVDAVLEQYTVYKVDSEAGGVGQLSSLLTGHLHSMMMFVVRERRKGARRTMAEESAVGKACMDLMSNHGDAIAKTLMAKAKDYYATFLQVQLRHAATAEPVQSSSSDDDDDDDYEDPPDDADDDNGSPPDSVTRQLLAKQGAKAAEEAQGILEGDELRDRLVTRLGCVDVELLCAFWASIGECAANPVYMRGTKAKRGHCELSCGMCKPDDSWQKHPQAKAELELASINAVQSARSLACAASKACLTGVSGTSAGTGMIQVAALEPPTPGALLAKLPGFVLGKPFWGTPGIRDAKVDASNRTAPLIGPGASEEDAVLHGALGNRVLSIPGMDGFFNYELVYRQMAYHYHEEDDGQLTEHWVLGAYDHAATVAQHKAHAKHKHDSETAKLWRQQRAGRAASDAGAAEAADAAGVGITARSKAKGGTAGTGAAGAADPVADGAHTAASKPAAARDLVPPPFLEILDLLPDVPGIQERYWPYFSQQYSGGQVCELAGGVKRQRSAEVRFACSPDEGTHMLVREPQFCSYVYVVYTPALCQLEGYKPVVRPKGSGLKKAAGQKVEGGDKLGAAGERRGGPSDKGSSKKSSSSSSSSRSSSTRRRQEDEPGAEQHPGS